MKTVLVTGGDGQLATCIKQVVKNVEDKKFVFKNSTELNITSKAELNSFFADNSIDYCINSAAYTAVDKAESNSKLAFEINSIAILFDNIADAFSDNPSPSEAEVTLSGGLQDGLTKMTEPILPGGLREKGGSPSQDEATCC